METVWEKRARLDAEDLKRQREVNARLRKEAIAAQEAQRKAPKVIQPEPEEAPVPAPEMSVEEEFRKNRPTYFKK